MARWLMLLLGLAVVAGAALTLWVEREAEYQVQELGRGAPRRALVLYHPSRDAHFSDELSIALAEGIVSAGWAVDRVTTTSRTTAGTLRYDLIVVVSNTYWWTPDLPTLRFLRRTRLGGIPAIGVIGGAGSTGRSRRLLREALTVSGARVLEVRDLWILRPNDERRMSEDNRAVARELARRIGENGARQAVDMRGSVGARAMP